MSPSPRGPPLERARQAQPPSPSALPVALAALSSSSPPLLLLLLLLLPSPALPEIGRAHV